MLALFCLLVTIGHGYGAIMGPCTAKHAEVEAFLAARPGFTGKEYPVCDAQGNFEAIQYKGSMAICSTPNDGLPIRNYMANRGQADAMHCRCALAQHAYGLKGIVGKMFHCADNGNYAPVGCTGSVCYCQDQFGKQIGTSGVNIGKIASLNC